MPAAAVPAWLVGLTAVVIALQLTAAVRSWRRLRRGRPLVSRRWRVAVPWGVEGAALAGVFVSLSVAATLSALFPVELVDREPPTLDLTSAAALGVTWGMLSTLAIGWLWTNYTLKAGDFGLPHSLGEAARDTALGVTACAVMLLPVYAVQTLLVWGVGLPSSHPTVKQLLENPSFGTIAAAILMAVVIAPIFEELAFRVLLQGWLERLGGRRAWWPILGSSAAFAMAHSGQGWAPVPLMVLALGLGYLYRQTHRFVPVVAMHMAFNALGLALALAATQAASGQGAPAP